MNSFKRALAFILTLALLSLPFLVYFKANALVDWWQLRDYTPPASIAQLANQDTMTAYTRHMFYLNHPQLVSGVNNFRKYCPDSEQTIVLGCYHPDQDGIYIYEVSDPELYGIQQVTAAHEVLHAVYARLSHSARDQLDSELQDFYKTGLKDPEVIAEVKIYQQTEPDDVYDEMSCTFGTELADLPPALDSYYKPYFSSRLAIVNYEQSYQGEFNSRQAAVKADDDQLAQMKSTIDQEENSLNSQLQQINSDRARLNNERSSNPNQYDSDVPGFNGEIDSYNAGIDKLRSDISAYNSLVAQRNSIAQELASLDSAIDTRLTTQSAQ